MPTSTSEPSSSTEAQVRAALEHMGGRRITGQQPGQHGQSSAAGNGQPSSNRAANNPASGRHRYVREGEVPVVHASLGRPTLRQDHPGAADRPLLDLLRHDLERERGLREAAERALAECRTSLTASQTRLAHLEMDLKAAQGQVSSQTALTHEATQARQAAEMLHEQAASVIVTLNERLQARTAVPLRRLQTVRTSPREPQPVKWWVKD